MLIVVALVALLVRHEPRVIYGAARPFAIVALPDTQKYVKYDASESRAQIFRRQTEWIARNRDAYNIVFVTHEGDLVDNGAAYAIEWERADAAMAVLDRAVPYSTVIGNHDYEQVGQRSSGAATYLRYFGPQRYQDYAWYGGASSDGLNQYQVFRAGDWTLLHLGLELEARDGALAWAQSVLDAHRSLPTIITTHAYQDDLNGRTMEPEFQGNSGEKIWQKFVRKNPQIFMVLNGHFYKDDGERHQVSYNDAGLPVFEIVANYQNHLTYPNGGNGYLRLMTFDPAAGSITVRTYSPTANAYLSDADSEFSLAVDFKQRFGWDVALEPTPLPTPSPPPTAQQSLWLPMIILDRSDMMGSGP